jgi:hypothetical protein
MADRNEKAIKGKDGIYVRVELGEVTVSNADTVTFDKFSDSDNLWEAYFIKKSDGSEMTCTHAANNVATISGAGTNIECFYLVYGVKA